VIEHPTTSDCDEVTGGNSSRARVRDMPPPVGFVGTAGAGTLPRMGQPVAVVLKNSPTPGVVRFETNRSITGMGHESFRTVADAVGPRPAAALARSLLATGHVERVHIFANIVTVDLLKGFNSDGLSDVVRDMYQYWKPGMEPPAFVEPVPEEGAAPAAVGEAPAAGASPYELRIPATLRERSAAALAKWQANH
jgi:hypothetical protein